MNVQFVRAQAFPSDFNLPVKGWLIRLFLIASPFYVFAVFTDRDWPAFWIVLLMMALWLIEVIKRDGSFLYDRSFLYLFVFLIMYLIGTVVVLFSDTPLNALGRTPLDRALTTIYRMIYVVLAYIILLSFLAECHRDLLRKIFVWQIIIGMLVALFGVVQYVSNVFFGWSGLILIEPTNETYKLYSSFFGHGSQRFYRSAAFFSEPSAFGFFLIPFFVKAVVAKVNNEIIGGHVIHSIIIGVFILAIAFNLSMTAVGSAGLIMFLFGMYSLRRSRHFWKFILLSVLIAGAIVLTPAGGLVLQRLDSVFGLRDVSTLDRLFRVVVGWKVFLENPFFGVGPGGFVFLYSKFGGLASGGLATPLNVWITFLTDVGIIGIIPFFLFLVNVLSRGYRFSKHDPLLKVYFWGTLSFLILLTTMDGWFLETFWFEIAMVVVLANLTHVSLGKFDKTTAFEAI